MCVCHSVYTLYPNTILTRETPIPLTTRNFGFTARIPPLERCLGVSLKKKKKEIKRNEKQESYKRIRCNPMRLYFRGCHGPEVLVVAGYIHTGLRFSLASLRNYFWSLRTSGIITSLLSPLKGSNTTIGRSESLNGIQCRPMIS